LDAGDHVKADALFHLSSWGFELWEQRFSEAQKYEFSETPDSFLVHRLDTHASPRVISKNGGTCLCNARVSYAFPCPHEICMHNYQFIVTHVDQRWLKRNGLSGSADVGRNGEDSDGSEGADDNLPPPTDTYDDESVQFDCLEHATRQSSSQIPQSQVDRSNQTNRGSGYGFLMDICQNLASTAAGHKLEVITSGLILQLTNVLQGTRHVDVGSGWDNMVASFEAVVDTYKNAFSGSASRSTALQVSGLPNAPAAHAGRPQSKRWKSSLEKNTKKNVIQSCGFCGSTEHQRQTICPRMAGLGKRKDDVEEFQAYLLESAPFSDWNNPDEVPVMKTVPNSARHIVIHQMHSSFRSSNATRPAYLHTIYHVTMIGKYGLPLPEYVRVFFEGHAIMSFLSKITKTRGRHVFSTLETNNHGITGAR
jgi:hypothetical protein